MIEHEGGRNADSMLTGMTDEWHDCAVLSAQAAYDAVRFSVSLIRRGLTCNVFAKVKSVVRQ